VDALVDERARWRVDLVESRLHGRIGHPGPLDREFGYLVIWLSGYLVISVQLKGRQFK
jgi:hypothetical protein